jgi:hypothetical protein
MLAVKLLIILILIEEFIFGNIVSVYDLRKNKICTNTQ